MKSDIEPVNDITYKDNDFVTIMALQCKKYCCMYALSMSTGHYNFFHWAPSGRLKVKL